MAFKLRAPFLNTEDEEGKKNQNSIINTDASVGQNREKQDNKNLHAGDANDLQDNSFQKSKDVNANNVESEVEEKEKGSGTTLKDLKAEIDPEKGFNANLKRRIDEASNAREKQRRENRLERKEERQETSAKKKKAKHDSKMNNPAKKARKLVKAKNQETRLAEKKKRQQERAKTIMKKNFGSEENAKEFEESLTNEGAPTNYMASAMDLQDNSDVEGAMEKAKKAAPTKAVGAIASLAAPIIKQAAVGAIGNKMQEMMESPNTYKPNRAGGPLNRNQLQMSPILKTYKQSHTGAVGMMKMQNIAQDAGPANMNEGFESLPDDVQDKILKNDK